MQDSNHQYEKDVKNSAEYGSHRNFWRSILQRLSTLGIIILAGVIAYLINNFAIQTYQVIGQSMEPTLQQGDYLLISKIGKTISEVTNDPYVPDRKSVIVFHSPEDHNIRLIKRVIGVPGDRVVVEDGEITVFNEEYPEGLNPDKELSFDNDFAGGNVDVTLNEDEIFVVGDNRGLRNSLDSRNKLGPVPVENVIGKLIIRLYPINNVRQFSVLTTTAL